MKVEGPSGAFAVDDAVFRSALRAKCYRLSKEVEILVFFSRVYAVTDENRIPMCCGRHGVGNSIEGKRCCSVPGTRQIIVVNVDGVQRNGEAVNGVSLAFIFFKICEAVLVAIRLRIGNQGTKTSWIQ